MFDPQKPHFCELGSTRADLRTTILHTFISEGPLRMRIVAEKPETHFQLAPRLVIAHESSLHGKGLILGCVDGLEINISLLAFASTYKMQ